MCVGAMDENAKSIYIIIISRKFTCSTASDVTQSILPVQPGKDYKDSAQGWPYI